MKIASFFLLCIACFSCNTVNNREVSKKVIMAVFAHPDDEVDVSPLLSKLAKEGHKVYLVIATKGEIGVTAHAKIPAGDSLANVRAAETECTCKILGILPPVLLGLGDASLTNHAVLDQLHHKLDSAFQLYKPDMVITWGPDGGSGHPDHRMVHNVVTEIFQSGQSPAFSQLWFTGIPTENWRDRPDYKTELGKSVHDTYHTVKKEYLTTRIACSPDDIQKGVEAMYCYHSQYTKEEMADNRLWTLYTNKDTVYLRPYSEKGAVSYDLFDGN